MEQSSKDLNSCTDRYLKALADEKQFKQKHKKAIALFGSYYFDLAALNLNIKHFCIIRGTNEHVKYAIRE